MKKKHTVPLANIELPPATASRVATVVASNRLTYGRYTRLFEKQFAKTVGVTTATFCNSGTSALQLVLTAMKELYRWEDGDEILVPAVTFIATSNAVIHSHLTPVFVDIEENFYCMNPANITRHITRRTRAILPVHLFGQSADMDEINRIAKAHHLLVIEDAAEALFTEYKGKPVGSLSDASIFSTYAAHTITTGVGGFACTSNPKLANITQSLCYHGRDAIYQTIDDDNTTNPMKLISLVERRFHFPHVGFSMRLTEMEAAIGLVQLAEKHTIIRERKRVDRGLRNAITVPMQLPAVRPNTDPIFMLYPLVLMDPAVDRDVFLFYLEQHGIETRLFFPMLSQPIYIKRFGDLTSRYPVVKKLTERGFIIGCHPGLTQDDILYIGNIFSKFFR